MRTIALISQKGGVGKTTLTINLAVAAHREGRQVVVADTDPQQSTFEWYKGRKDRHPLPYVAQVFPTSLGDIIEKAARNGADAVFVDSSPNSTEESLAIADQVDLLVVPCAPSLIDLRALKRTEQIIRLSGKPACAVLNLCPPVGDDADQAEAALQKLGLTVCPQRLVNRAVTRRAYALDLAVLELEPQGKAASEVLGVHKFTWRQGYKSTREQLPSRPREKANKGTSEEESERTEKRYA